MTAVNSSTQLCNLALSRLGHFSISAIGEATKAGELCAVNYDATRDAVLRSHPWNFAVKRAVLAQLSAAPAWGYDYAYQLPTNPYCLKVIRTSLEAEGCDHDYRIEGRQLLSDESEVSIEFIGRVTAVGEYDPLFVQVLALNLAVRMCMPLADNATLLGDLKIELKDIQPGAQSVDAQEGSSRDAVDATGWVRARL